MDNLLADLWITQKVADKMYHPNRPKNKPLPLGKGKRNLDAKHRAEAPTKSRSEALTPQTLKKTP